MGITDAGGFPIAACAGSASPHEVKLVDDALDACFLESVPGKIIGDTAYDSDPLDNRLAQERGVEMMRHIKTIASKRRPRMVGHCEDTESVGRLNGFLPGFKTFVVL
jgi:hypothetical protein